MMKYFLNTIFDTNYFRFERRTTVDKEVVPVKKVF